MRFIQNLSLLLLTTIPVGAVSIGAQDNWPQFRGPTRDGYADSKTLLLTWNESTNFVWKTHIHDRGWSSPVIWGNQIWLTTVNRDGTQLFTTVDRDNPELWAIRANGTGDVSESHVVWKEQKAMPRRCSPLLVSGRLYLVSRAGVVTCLDAKTGEQVWRDRVSASHSASPIYAQKHIYLFNDDGVTFVIEPVDSLKVIAKNQLAKVTLMASPAVSNSSLFVKTESNLYRIEKPSVKR